MTISPTLRWGAFWLVNLVTFVSYRAFWMFERYGTVLKLLGVIAVALAVSIVMVTKCRPRTLLALAVGLALGQWWWLESVAMYAYGKVNGFAP